LEVDFGETQDEAISARFYEFKKTADYLEEKRSGLEWEPKNPFQ